MAKTCLMMGASGMAGRWIQWLTEELGDRVEIVGLVEVNEETCSYKEFRYGVSDRGASVRIPWQVARDQKGYIEDRRPNANCDPYIVTRLIIDTVCGAATGN